MSELASQPHSMMEAPTYEDVVATLPLADCNVTKNSMLAPYEAENETEYIAPQEHAFQIMGRFIVEAESSKINDYCSPTEESRQYFIDEHKEKIEQLQANGISQDQAFEIFMTNYFEDAYYTEPFTPPDLFLGQNLAIRPEGRASGWQLVIKGPVEAGTRPGINTAQIDMGNGKREVGFTVPDQIFYWHRPVAIGMFGECSIEIVDYNQPEPELWLPEEADKTLWSADNPYPDLVDEYGEFVGLFAAVMLEEDISMKNIRTDKVESESSF